jgi:Ca2+/Na+ antiporter
MPLWMVGLGVLGTIALLVTGQPRTAAGFALGAALGILGYFWLHQAVVALMDSHTTRAPRDVALKIVLRYILMLAVILLFSRTGWLPVLAVFGGLLVPAGGATIESLRLVFAGFHSTDSA